MNDKNGTLRNNPTYLLFIFLAALASMLNSWEPGGESWTYWYFTRVLNEGGGFINFDRSPIYTIYLSMFYWIGYPISVGLEYLVTTVIIAVSSTIFLKRFIGIAPAAFGSLLWIIFIQDAEPPVQKFSFAFSLLAINERLNGAQRKNIVLSYTFLLLAYCFRSTYVILLILILSWDIYTFQKSNFFQKLKSHLKIKLQDWPILTLLTSLPIMKILESNHPWNNAWGVSNTWFPQTRGLIDGAFLQHYNWIYILDKYGTYKNKDWFFTNQELFSGAGSIFSAIIANPNFFFQILFNNLLKVFETLRHIITSLPIPWYVFIIVILSLIYTAYYQNKNPIIRIFVIASVLMIFATVLSEPKPRYMIPFIPILFLSSIWMNKNINSFLKNQNRKYILNQLLVSGIISQIVILFLWYYQVKIGFSPHGVTFGLIILSIVSLIITFLGISPIIFTNKNIQNSVFNLFKSLIIFLLLIMLSRGALDWTKTGLSTLRSIKKGNITLLSSDNNVSLRRSFNEVSEILKDCNCNGIMTLENRFFGSFLDFPIEKVYDVWEIPPYKNDTIYQDMNVDRIDCLLLSETLMTGFGKSTNWQIRYDNYIKPYRDELIENGAKVYKVENFGEFIALR